MHATEELLLDAFVDALRALDPDIIVGFEVQKGSLGYLVDRAASLERTTLLREVSRIPDVSAARFENPPPSRQPLQIPQG